MLDRLRGRKRWAPLDEGIQLNAKEIKETFHLFDMNHGGTLHFGDLECKLEDVGIHLTEQQFGHMMKLIKRKGHMINFYQYLAVINNKANYVNKIAAGKITKEKIYDILVKFMKRSALSNLSDLRAKAPQVIHPRLPNVLKHFLVGVTLQGLTQRQLAKKVEEMKSLQSPRRATTGSLRPRRSLENTCGGGRQIARASSDQICQIKDEDRYLTSLISLTSVRGKSKEMVKEREAKPSFATRSRKSSKATSSDKKRSDGDDIKRGSKSKRSSSLSTIHQPRESGDLPLKFRKSQSCDQGKSRARGAPNKSPKSPRSIKLRVSKKGRRMYTAPPLRGSARVKYLPGPKRISTGASFKSSRAILNTGKPLVRPKYSTTSSSGPDTSSAKSFLRFMGSEPTFSGTNGDRKEFIKRYIRSSLPHGGRMDKTSLNQLDVTKSATVQVGGPHGENPRRSMVKHYQRSKSSDQKEPYNFFQHRNYKRRRSLVSKAPAYPGLPYITPYYFPKMTYFDLPSIRNEMAVRRSICSEVMNRQFEEKWRKRNLMRAFNSISSPSLQRRFERAVHAYGYKLK